MVDLRHEAEIDKFRADLVSKGLPLGVVDTWDVPNASEAGHRRRCAIHQVVLDASTGQPTRHIPSLPLLMLAVPHTAANFPQN
jgi:hypothetical protein